MKLYLIASTLFLSSLALSAQSTHKSLLPLKPAKGATVAGIVECDGKPVEGVRVSDGYIVTSTDRKGAYSLKSKKRNPQVFISIPSGYEASREDAVPQFWADFTADSVTFERHDFLLRPVDQSRHAVITLADIHLANQRNDVATFSNKYVAALRDKANELKERNIPVYTINLGDGTWDAYWYAFDLQPKHFREILSRADYPTPFFNCMGNHDHNGAEPAGPDTDFLASLPYQKSFGPRYYSFNIGGVHYVVLDDVFYKNQKGKAPTMPGIAGRRNYDDMITSEQLDWLRKDLEGIPTSTPIVVAMHVPMLKWKGISDEVLPRLEKESVDEFMSIVEPFDEVHTISGHSHRQVLTRMPGDKIRIDHNMAGTSGAWWWTAAFGGNNLCPDGNPVAYDLFTADGTKLEWEHIPFEYPADRQFWAWDMNKVKEYFDNNAEYRTLLRFLPKYADYSDVEPNTVWIDLWAWDPAGKLSVKENGRELPVEQFIGQNPMYNSTYALERTVWVNNYAGMEEPRKLRMFRVKTSAPDTPVEVTWTDPFGRSFTQTLTRPATFIPE